MAQPKCKRCGKPILGSLKIKTTRQTLGKKSVLKENFYDEDCFYIINKEKAQNEYSKKSPKR